MSSNPEYLRPTSFSRKNTVFRLVRAHGRETVYVKCASCDQDSTGIQLSGPANIKVITRRFEDQGWVINAFNHRKCYCPACLGRKSSSPHTATAVTLPVSNPVLPDTLEEFMPKPPVVVQDIRTVTGRTPSQPEIQNLPGTLAHALERKFAGMPPPPKQETTVKERTLDAHHKLKVRELLDTNFDEVAGRYSDGWSDQRIGTDVNVPWSLVSKLREAAYGPVKVDPELDSMRTELIKIGQTVADLQLRNERTVDASAQIETSLGQAREQVTALLNRLDARGRQRA